MAGVSLSGLASGLDTGTMVTQLMAIERQPLNRLEASRLRVEGRRTAIEDVAVRLRALNTARADLTAVTTFQDVQKTESSDPLRVGARAPVAGAAVPGTYTLAVSALAETQMWTMTQGRMPPGQRTTSIQVGTTQATAKTYTTTGGTTVAALADTINADPARVVDARVSGGQLVLESRVAGTAFYAGGGDFTRDTSAPALSRTATAAQFTLTYGDQAVTSAVTVTGNTVAYGGMEFDLRRPTVPGPAVTVTVGAVTKDHDAIKAKVKAFVDAYNATVDFARAKLTEARVKDPKLAGDHAKGALRGDVGLSSVMSRLRIALGQRVEGQPPAADALADLGVSILAPASGKSDADRLAGKLVLDEAKLTAAVQADPEAARAVFEAVGARVDAIVAPFARASDGVLALRSQEADREAGRIRGRKADLEQRLDKREERLRAYFTRLETSLQGAQAQTAWLQGQLAGLG